MFSTILIANRGEIACRVIRTARRLGIRTVAVFSEADADAQHVRLADEAHCIGGPRPQDSYLRGDAILEVASRTGAQAIHPGYGFLSENADFADAVQAAGLAFIGPSGASMRKMGSKAGAKDLMAAAGVPVVPGYTGEDQSPELLQREADRIGYPLMIKAAHGGGGKGMRIVRSLDEFLPNLESCQREAKSAFGRDRVLLERYIESPRHIEIQVFGDSRGNAIHLGERECSAQRRYQKVLEESPSPFLTPALRAAMGAAAVQAAHAIDYANAGTVEFIVGQDGGFYFMEINTRLQVEHPVTEEVTGLDLVEWQLRVASGEPLPMRQEQLAIDGHAIEARIYAENPDNGFLPSTGRLVHLAPPAESDTVRVDTGVEQGDEITPFYDPMIAKLIVWGEDRRQALARMRQALASYRVVGVANNIEFLARLVSVPSFANAELDTGLIEREQALLFPPDTGVPEDVWRVATLAELLREQRLAMRRAGQARGLRSPWDALDGWRLNGEARRWLTLRHGEQVVTLEVRPQAGGWSLGLEGRGTFVRGSLGADSELQAQLGERRLRATVVVTGERRQVFLEGRSWPLSLVDTLYVGGECDDGDGGGLRAPMPGKIIALLAEAGARVDKGAPLLVLEAMKMEHTISAPRKGTVRAFRFAPGDQVSDGAELVDFEAAE